MHGAATNTRRDISATVLGLSAAKNAQCRRKPSIKADGYRLPTEAEWEYAARYIDGTTFKPGDFASGATAAYTDGPATAAVAWYSSSMTHAVGGKTANALGLYDMSGNVWEWTWDWQASYTTGSPYTDADSKGPATGTNRVLRGGSWNTSAGLLQAASRDFSDPWGTYDDFGFRPVRRP